MKRIVSFILTLSLCFGLMAMVPASAEENAFGWEIPAETIHFTVFQNSNQFSTGEEQKVGLEHMQKYLLDVFNVDFQYITTDGNADEQLNLMLASDTYPDVIISASTTNRQKMVEQGRAVDLTDYLENCPNINRRLGDMKGLYADENGRIYYLPETFSNLMDLPDYSAHVRYDEYLELGEPAIKTPEDYFNVIQAIYEAHPTTPNGEARYTLGLYDQGMPEYLSGYWGLERGWEIGDDDTLTYWTHSDAGKEMAKYFNNWWRTGTMDPDSMTNAWNDLRTKVSQERVVGLIGGWWIGYNAGHEVWSLTDENWTENKRFIQVGFKAEDAENAYVTVKNNAGSHWVIVTDKCKDVEGFMKFLDFTLSDKGIALTNWGIPNEVESYKNPGTTERIWVLNEDGSWEFDETSKQQLISETWDYNEEGVYGANTGIFSIMNFQGRFDDAGHCLWPNQMWYSENKWKQIMFENMSGTIFDGTALLYESLPMDEDVTMAKTAIEDTWKQYYPQVIMAEDDDAFETAWLELQAAVESAGLDTYTAYRTANYQHNLELMGK